MRLGERCPHLFPINTPLIKLHAHIFVGKTKRERQGLTRHYSETPNPASPISKSKILAPPTQAGHKADRIQKHITTPNQTSPLKLGFSDIMRKLVHMQDQAPTIT
jgi:hypothetical protein